MIDPGARGRAGFTLLEVMIAVAVIAIALVTLLGAQSRSVAIATDSRFDLIAALLAQEKLTELVVAGYAQLETREGDFGREYPDFVWKTEVRILGEDELGLEGAGDLVKRLDLTVSARQDAKLSFTVRTLIGEEPEPLPTEGKAGAGAEPKTGETVAQPATGKDQ